MEMSLVRELGISLAANRGGQLVPLPGGLLLVAQGRTTQGDDDVLARLERSEIYREYQLAFVTTTGLPLLLQSAALLATPLRDLQPAHPLGTLLAARNPSCAASLRLQRWIGRGARDETRTVKCRSGLCESAVPVRLGSRVIGFLRTGLVLEHQPSEARFLGLLRRLREGPAGPAAATLHTAYFATRAIATDQYESVLRLLAIFARHLALLAGQLMIAETAVESPSITKARHFIADHHGEVLSLSDVAQAVHMSPFYFCKMFRRVTGLRFTVYLARVRVEQVKHSLLQRHIRITEAAFGAGFQSLSQFNRVFRQVAGESPSAYRVRLGVPARVQSDPRPLARTA